MAKEEISLKEFYDAVIKTLTVIGFDIVHNETIKDLQSAKVIYIDKKVIKKGTIGINGKELYFEIIPPSNEEEICFTVEDEVNVMTKLKLTYSPRGLPDFRISKYHTDKVAVKIADILLKLNEEKEE